MTTDTKTATETTTSTTTNTTEAALTQEPLVSLIVPVYNAQDYLRYCVDSILGQSYRNLEVILIDDGSTDESPRLCDQFAAGDPRVVVIHQANGGIGKAQNAGLDAASGDYIAFADNDDILDKRNIELLLNALVSTGADMSKARWRQFGVSQLDEVAREAAAGAGTGDTDLPQHITVFKHPLHAYQTVFCKSLRLIGTALGFKTEAKYFNEANWCRLYRRELWDGIRFPEGVYAQDTAMACRLYERMSLVADIDVNLYNWLQRADSVTHEMKSASFYHDHVAASLNNMRICREARVIPARSYYTLVSNMRYERRATAIEVEKTARGQAPNETDEKPHAGRTNPLAATATTQTDIDATNTAVNALTIPQRMECAILRAIRLAEKFIYDRKIKNMQ
jgi:glycosyltransferase involved in cell wall biosynthesis